ncbi:hypothetical protein VHEMI07618 [[Torrubiella] hemipterigena]|uniref:Zn(2)-C6 fungal-type domain-containing protein n=1 Tax=[Torrubiella] hemipterigena TaxID=1531966 RepID=A0A0A1T420_9HYPO|nr:hypothetical protein VHEMI07618 [[Torrubiella] hemipterigena]
MVGVPRSKGCLTCRTRKKGCDKAIPTCSQCRKAGLQCAGYSRQPVFVHATATNNGTLSKVDAAARPWSSKYTKHANRPLRITPPDALVRTAREQLYTAYLWHTMTPKHQGPYNELSKQPGASWARAISEGCVTEPSLRFIAMAWAMGCMAVDNDDKQMRIKSFQTYNSAVRQLSLALRHDGSFTRDGLIMASGLMASFEMIFNTAEEPRVLAWGGHSHGQLAMFLIRGPAAFTSGDAHQLFVDSRINMAMLGIGQRKTSPISSVEWKSVPWMVEPKSARDKLIDAMLDIPALLEQLTDFRSCAARCGGRKLRAGYAAIDMALQSWVNEMGSQIQTFDYTVTGRPVPAPKTDAEFTLLNLSIIYWFLNMMLLSIKASVLEISGSGAHETLNSLRTVAKKCSSALLLLFGESSGLSQNITGLLSLSIALRYFLVADKSEQQSEEFLALRALLGRELAGTSVRQLVTRMGRGIDPLEWGRAGADDAVDITGWF